MKTYLFLSVSLGLCIAIQGQNNFRLRQALSANSWLNDVDGDNIPGQAGVDYPVHASVPQGTSFRCSNYDYAGYFGDVESDCQAYHVCFPDGRNASFLCVNGTVFHQRFFVCDWWFHYDCSGAINMYELNLYRKVPLPVLPPVARRPFPGPMPQLEPRQPVPQIGHGRPGPRSGDKRKPDAKERTPRVLQIKPLVTGGDNTNPNDHNTNKERKSHRNKDSPNLKPSNKYKKPQNSIGEREDKCNCQCEAG